VLRHESPVAIHEDLAVLDLAVLGAVVRHQLSLRVEALVDELDDVLRLPGPVVS